MKKSQNFCRKIAFLTNKKCLAGKTSVGICSYNVPRGLCAKFQPNRMDSLGDPGIQGAYLGVGKPKTQERARGPTHTRRIPYRMEIPAPSCYRGSDRGGRYFWHTSSKGMPRHAHRRWTSQHFVALYK